MFLSLLFRGASGYTLLYGTREVGSLSGTALRFYPFATEADAIRAADVGCHALVEWLASRAGTPPPGTRLLGDASPGESAPRWTSPDGTPLARTARHPSAEREALAHDGAPAPGAAYAVEFILPEGVYAAVALQPAQRIHEAIRGLEAQAALTALADAASEALGVAPAHGSPQHT